MIRQFVFGGIFTLFAMTIVGPLEAQTNLVIFNDGLNNGFQNWSWGNVSFNNSSPVFDGTNSISYQDVAWKGISFEHSDFDPHPYNNLDFWLDGGVAGGQIIQVYLQYSNSFYSGINYQLPPLQGGQGWEHFVIPFTSLGVGGVTNLSRINIQLTSNGSTNEFYMDAVNLSLTPPSVVALTVDASQTIRPAESKWFGLNTAVWDGNFDTPTTIEALNELDTHILRFPGGSLADTYNWATGKSGQNTWSWQVLFSNFIHVVTNTGAQTIITVNYGTGTPQEAAAWVAAANVTNKLGFTYWEVGNECYGTWETDSNTYPHDPYTYATRAAQYIQQMKAVDPNIKIGVPVVNGEDSNSNGYTNHPAYNQRTGTYHYGWTPVVLTTLHSLGVEPDFLIHHVYPEYQVDNDQLLLQESTNWAMNAADYEQQISDYLGSSGTNIELFCTENNADAGNQGKQSTSIVNGLYLADSLAQLMKTPFDSFVWWDLRNGTDTSGDFSPSLYGWRTYGDLGIINGLNTRHPVYFTYKLMQYFAQPGDEVLNPVSSYPNFLPVYATRKADGAIAALLINKDRYNSYVANINLSHYFPWTNATVRSFGILQDEATRTNSTLPGAQDISTNQISVSGTNVEMSVPPYTASLLYLPPSAPRLEMPVAEPEKVVFQLQGQPNVPYILEDSADLIHWFSVSTNVLNGNVLNITNFTTQPMRFWRAIWIP